MRKPAKLRVTVSSDNRVPDIVLRLRPKVAVRGEVIDTISAHNSILEQAGYIAVAKFGRAWPVDKCEEFSKALSKARPPRFIVVTKDGEHFSGWCAPLKKVVSGDDPSARRLVAPRYYRELASQPSLLETALAGGPGMWFVTAAKLKPCSLANLALVSSGRRLEEVLRETRTALMLVGKARRRPGMRRSGGES